MVLKLNTVSREPSDSCAQPWLRKLWRIYPILSGRCLSELNPRCLGIFRVIGREVSWGVVWGSWERWFYLHHRLDIWKPLKVHSCWVDRPEISGFFHFNLMVPRVFKIAFLVFRLSFDFEDSSLILCNLLLIIKGGAHRVIHRLKLYHWREGWTSPPRGVSPRVARRSKVHRHVL